MNTEENQPSSQPPAEPALRKKSPATTVFLIAAGLLLTWLSYRILQPFLTALAWAAILAVVFEPLHDRVSHVLRRKNLSAFVSTALTILIVIAPLGLVSLAIAREARAGYHQFAPGINSEHDLIEAISRSGILGPVWHWLQDHLQQWNLDIRELTSEALQRAGALAARALTQAVASLTTFFANLVLVAFALFYFFRDGRVLLGQVQRHTPMHSEIVEQIFHQIATIIRAAINGVVGINLLKGFLAGLAFQVLGLPSPVLWGGVGAVVSVIPVVGISLVWGPGVLVLWLQGHTLKAVLLAIWGLTVLSLIDNFLYPALVKNEVRLHTLLIFFSTLGGLAVFGLPGFVLGPVVAALSLTLLRVASDYYRLSSSQLPEEG